MLLGCIADDFTGASDLANTLAKGGMATVQFVGVPDETVEGGAAVACDAGVVALKSRSIAAADAVEQSLAALAWLKRQGCRQIVFKYCSTFDSTPAGNIGPVAEALAAALGAHADGRAIVVCPVFPATGRTLYLGHLFVNGRLLSESGLEQHPLNPMTDPDIRRWLRLQTGGEVGLVSYPVVRQGATAIREALQAEAAAGRRLAVVDALDDDDLRAIGEAVDEAPLVTGGSGIALGLPANFRRAGQFGARQPGFEPAAGPGIVLSGSCSPASQAQVAHFRRTHPGFAVEPGRLLAGEPVLHEALAFARAHRDAAPIVTSTADPAGVAAVQGQLGRERVAAAIEGFFGALATALAADGFVRIAVGGGETAGAVVGALAHDPGVAAFRIGPEIDPGVPALAAVGGSGGHAGGSLRLALKSGNFGGVDFYERALAALGPPR